MEVRYERALAATDSRPAPTSTSKFLPASSKTPSKTPQTPSPGAPLLAGKIRAVRLMAAFLGTAVANLVAMLVLGAPIYVALPNSASFAYSQVAPKDRSRVAALEGAFSAQLTRDLLHNLLWSWLAMTLYYASVSDVFNLSIFVSLLWVVAISELVLYRNARVRLYNSSRNLPVVQTLSTLLIGTIASTVVSVVIFAVIAETDLVCDLLGKLWNWFIPGVIQSLTFTYPRDIDYTRYDFTGILLFSKCSLTWFSVSYVGRTMSNYILSFSEFDKFAFGGSYSGEVIVDLVSQSKYELPKYLAMKSLSDLAKSFSHKRALFFGSPTSSPVDRAVNAANSDLETLSSRIIKCVTINPPSNTLGLVTPNYSQICHGVFRDWQLHVFSAEGISTILPYNLSSFSPDIPCHCCPHGG